MSAYRKTNIPNQGNMGAFSVDSEEEAGFNIALLTAVFVAAVVDVVVVIRFSLVWIELILGLTVVPFHGDLAYILFLYFETSLGIIS